MATLPMITNSVSTLRTRLTRSVLAVRTRWTGTKAASDNVTQGTWIIVAVALAALVVALIAIPTSPVHHWLTQLTNSITSISS